MLHTIYNSTPLWDYLIDNVRGDTSISFVKLERKKNLFTSRHIVMRIVNMCVGKYICLNAKYTIHGDTHKIKQNDDILLLGIYNYYELQWIRHRFKHNHLILWMWNPIDNTYKRRPSKVIDGLKMMNFDIYTFDAHDATKYGIGLKPQFTIIPERILNKENSSCHDVYFLGQPKGRLQKLNDVKTKLEARGIECFFIIVNGPSDYISYEDNIKHVCSSRCVLEICQPGQEGLTLRALEAILCKKKLITNNSTIKYADFYNKDNIFIIGEDSMNEMKSFTEKEFIPISGNVMEKYDFSNWLNSFITK